MIGAGSSPSTSTRMIVDFPSDSRTLVQVTKPPSGESCARLSSYLPASRLSATSGRDASRRCSPTTPAPRPRCHRRRRALHLRKRAACWRSTSAPRCRGRGPRTDRQPVVLGAVAADQPDLEAVLGPGLVGDPLTVRARTARRGRYSPLPGVRQCVADRCRRRSAMISDSRPSAARLVQTIVGTGRRRGPRRRTTVRRAQRGRPGRRAACACLTLGRDRRRATPRKLGIVTERSVDAGSIMGSMVAALEAARREIAGLLARPATRARSCADAAVDGAGPGDRARRLLPLRRRPDQRGCGR